jgi:hypothetical protein
VAGAHGAAAVPPRSGHHISIVSITSTTLRGCLIAAVAIVDIVDVGADVDVVNAV